MRTQTATQKNHRRPASQRGFSLIELLIGMSIMAVALLSIATMFSTGYTDVHAGGRVTLATAAARQMIEGMQNLPFDRLSNLDNYTTGGALPASNPERDLATRWRDVLASNGIRNGQVSVIQDSPTLRRITVTVQLPGRTGADTVPVQLATLISRL